MGLTIGGVLLAAGVVLVGTLWRKRASRDRYDDDVDLGEESSQVISASGTSGESNPQPELPFSLPAAALPSSARPDVAPRAMLELRLVPKRAGTNLLSASVEYTIGIENTGAAPASGVRLDIRLMSAGKQQDLMLATLFAAPIANPVTAPFDLPAGAAVELSGMALHPKETLEVLDVEGRTLFVPVLAINLEYQWDGGSGQTAMSYVIGVNRGGTGKLQPFSLDGAARMYDTVGALAYTVKAIR